MTEDLVIATGQAAGACLADDPIALYRYFDASDRLLYIGVTNDPDYRWNAHRWGPRRHSWCVDVARRSLEWYVSRPLALAAEKTAIKAERPRYNETYNYDEAPFDPGTWPTVSRPEKVRKIADLIRHEILRGHWTSGQLIPSLRSLGTAVGASSRTISQAAVLLQDEGILELRPGRGLFVSRLFSLEPTAPQRCSCSSGAQR
ncbi:GntR family transcriptional regulator [Streptomyces sp. N35]|uniref:GntR family transcriptional regulator n=1 Tax=Streptomyces sp. N35 TaxID=2795730 RepID=UPI0018F3427E|nr:GntR family transcriptional regulator [Streptomyces sp. N35]